MPDADHRPDPQPRCAGGDGGPGRLAAEPEDVFVEGHDVGLCAVGTAKRSGAKRSERRKSVSRGLLSAGRPGTGAAPAASPHTSPLCAGAAHAQTAAISGAASSGDIQRRCCMRPLIRAKVAALPDRARRRLRSAEPWSTDEYGIRIRRRAVRQRTDALGRRQPPGQVLTRSLPLAHDLSARLCTCCDARGPAACVTAAGRQRAGGG